ncbi:3'-5' exonuclease, partial [Vibrio vulnificus]|uniref:3'-5' exonuclease n=1 Tax=Vibrio vulnificus TaxID=672 RepID=UPI0039B5B752
SERDEMALITRTLKKMHAERGVAWADMCIACPDRYIGERMNRYLKASSIPVHWLSDSQSKRRFRPSEDTVKLMTMHSSKGLEFPFVVVC